MTGTGLPCRQFGAGRAVLALHCALAHAGAWGALAANMPGWQVTAPDLPGHGRAADWDRQGDYHSLATAGVLPVLAAFGGVVPVIGHSFGATVALRLALENPGSVSALVLFEPVLFCAADPASFAAHWAAHERFGAAMQAGNPRDAAAAFQAIWGGGQSFDMMPEAQQAYIADRIGLIPAQNPVLVEDNAGLLAPGRLEALDIPVLLIRGAASPPIIAAIHAELARRLPRAQCAVVPGAGHMLPITHADACAALALDFLPA